MDDTAESIHDASLVLLEKTGVKVEHDGVLEALIQAGAKPGTGSQVVRFPRQFVHEKLELCPKTVVLADRSGNRINLTATSEPTFWSIPGLNIWQENRHRPFTMADMAAMSCLLDQLSNVNVVFGMALEDVPAPACDVVGLKIMAENTSKHLRVLCFDPGSMDTLIEIRNVIGNQPWFSIGFTAHGPLRWTHLALEMFHRTAGHGIPTTVNGEPMAGTSGPVTLAGSAAVGNAEILAGIVINQILEPGRPCIYNLGLAHIFDMKYAVAVTGGPENALFAQISAMMGRFYSLPSASWVSTEAMCPDSQAALEKMFGFHTHLEERVSCIWGIGQLESELTLSPAQAVIDNEMINYAKRYQKGPQINADTLATDIIQEVGITGSFLEHEHTLKHFREEFFVPDILFRKRRSDWNAEGRKRLDERAEETANSLISNKREDTGLNSNQLRELERLVQKRLKVVENC